MTPAQLFYWIKAHNKVLNDGAKGGGQPKRGLKDIANAMSGRG